MADRRAAEQRWDGIRAAVVRCRPSAGGHADGLKVGPEETVCDSKGNVIDEANIERAVEDVHHHLGRGRPSLTKPGGSLT